MRRSIIGTVLALCAFLGSSSTASAHHDPVCTPQGICVTGIQHVVGDPGATVRALVEGTIPYAIATTPEPLCAQPPLSPRTPICITGLRAFAQQIYDLTAGPVLEPAYCDLWTALNWPCD